MKTVNVWELNQRNFVKGKPREIIEEVEDSQYIEKDIFALPSMTKQDWSKWDNYFTWRIFSSIGLADLSPFGHTNFWGKMFNGRFLQRTQHDSSTLHDEYRFLQFKVQGSFQKIQNIAEWKTMARPIDKYQSWVDPPPLSLDSTFENSLLKSDLRDKCEKNVHLDPEDLFSEVLKVVECGLGSYAVHQHEALNNNKNVNNRTAPEQDSRRNHAFWLHPPHSHISFLGVHNW
jgi:hypothetical protein